MRLGLKWPGNGSLEDAMANNTDTSTRFDAVVVGAG
tara:strand:+ start:4491 stop:4598 length:108 start_codon:yes stop_codon:yes gene_type:complete